MVTSKNIDSLKQNVLKNIENVLATDVKEHLVKKVNERIRIDVYGSYSPQVYTRKFKLYDQINHRHEIASVNKDKVEMKYFHRAYTNEKKDLSKLIILGQAGAKAYGQDIAYYNEDYIKAYIASGAVDSRPFYKSRDFIGNAKKEINKTEIANLLKKGMK